MQHIKWFHLIVLIALLLTIMPVQAAPPELLVEAQPSVGFYKVIADPGVLDANQPGITLWHDYGAFALYRVERTAMLALPTTTQQQVTALPDADRISINAYPFDTQTDTFDRIPESLRVEQAKGPALHLIQFVGPIKEAWLDSVRATGATPIHYVANYGYLVWADDAARAQLDHIALQKDVVQFSAPYQPYFKLGNSLQKRIDAGKLDETVEVTIQMYNHPGKIATENLIRTLVVEDVSPWTSILAYQNLVATVRISDLVTLAQQPDILWIGERFPRQLNDEVQDQILAGNFDAGQTGPSSPGYLAFLSTYSFSTNPADYPIVDVTDDGIGNGTVNSGDYTLYRLGITSNPSRLAYVGNCTTDTLGDGVGGHGHLNTNIVGGYDPNEGGGFPYEDGNSYLRGLGVSPYGRLAGTKIFANSGSYNVSACGGTDTGVIKRVQDSGAQINTNSWGCSGCAGTYDDSSQAYDVGVRDADLTETGNQELIIFFSAGNSGPSVNTIGTPGNGKNMITVGASENDRPSDEDGNWTDGCGIGPTGADNAMDVISFSSRGPAPGGRVKPEIIAPGTHIQGTASTSSAYNGSGVCDQYRPSGQTTFAASSGTSHSTPAAAGVGSLYYYWMEREYGITPSPAMMKAYMIAHPTYLTGVAANDTLPSNAQGYGMPNLTLAFDNTPRHLLNQTHLFDNTGETWTYQGRVADPTKPVRIVLAYTDKAGAIGTSPEVNNLNLDVTVGGQTYLGNNFSGQWSTTGGSVDADNNYEAVFLPAGANGIMDITVTAFNIADDGVPNTGDGTDQDFALIIYNVAPPEGLGWLQGTISETATTALIADAVIQATGAISSNGGSTVSATDGYYHMALMTDTYTVTVTAYGYQPAEVSGISVVSGTTTTQNISLTPASSYILSGTVTDANTGWALYASVEIIPDGYPAQTVWTNPWTGAYSVTLVGNYTHTLNVEPWNGLPGYVPQSREINLTGDAVENFALEVDDVACAAPGYTTPGGLSEGFEDATFPPTGWTAYNVDNDGGGTQWTRSTARFHSGSASALHAYDAGTPAEDGWLRFPQLALGATPELRFWESVNYSGDYVKHSLWACTTACGTPPTNYTEVAEYSSPTEDTWMERVTNLSAYAGQTVYLAFRYEGENADDWYIDDVRITAPCNAPTGGLLVGSVYDFNTNGHLTGAHVHNSLGGTATAQATPGSPTLSDALYALYAPSGSQTFTATMSGYEASIVSGYPVQDGVTQRQDFFLHAGYPQAAPDALHVSVGTGLSTTRQLVVSNMNASTPFEFEFKERNGGFAPELAAEDVLVVRRDTAAAGAMETALTALGYTFLGVTVSEFQALSVSDLLEYPAIFYAGVADGSVSSGTDHTLLIGYLDGGGKLYISDNDLGYYHRTTDPTGFYGTYLQSTYVLDNYGDGVITGMDFMTGLNPDTTADLYPDGFTVGAEGVKLFNAPTNDAAGIAVERNGYQALYTSFDFDDIASADDEVELIRRVVNFFGLGDVPWLATDPITGTVAASGQVVVDVSFDSGVASAVGDYYATLILRNDSPYGDVTIPVTMTVVTPTLYVSTGSGDWNDLGSWSGSPTRLPTAADNVTIAAGTEITVDDASECFDLTVEAGARLNVAGTLYVYGAVTNQGQLHQEALVDGSGTVDFLMLDDGMGNVKFYGITLEAAGVNMGDTSVDIYGQVIEGTGNLSQTVETWFDITPAYPVAAPTVVPITFWYPNSALNGNAPGTANVYHYAGSGNWEALNKLANGADGSWEWITAEATDFSPFVIKSPEAPTAVVPHGLAGSANFYGIVVIGLAIGAVVLLRKRSLARE